MKKFVIFFVCFLIFNCCKKEAGKHCPFITDSNTSHLVDITPLNSAPEIMDTLNKNPQLQVYRIIDDSLSIGAQCNVFYKGLKIFREYFSIYKCKKYNCFYCSYSDSSIVTASINISLSPSISLESANEIAEKNVNYKDCTFSQLGLSNIGTAQNPNYKLIWRIQGAAIGSPAVELDAQNGTIYMKEEGNAI